jgi:hypothetical protein
MFKSLNLLDGRTGKKQLKYACLLDYHNLTMARLKDLRPSRRVLYFLEVTQVVKSFAKGDLGPTTHNRIEIKNRVEIT